MHVSVIKAEAEITDLIRLAQAGEDVVLISGDGRPVRLVRAGCSRAGEEARPRIKSGVTSLGEEPIARRSARSRRR